MTPPLHGLVAATHSPFHPDGSLAADVVPLLASHLAARGIATVFITGSTGEAHSLTRDERLALYRAWAEAAPAVGISVVAHVGSNCLHDARSFASAAAECGFAAISALAPSYYKPADLEHLVRCCEFIAAAAPDTPFYYYDIPALTGVEHPVDEFLALAAERIPSLAGVKFTRDDLDAYARCLRAAGGRFDLPWGVDERLLDAMKLGGRGAVGSSYNFAAPIYQEMLRAAEAGDEAGARACQRRAVRLIDTLAEFGYLAAAKALLGWQGVPVGPARLPLGTPTPPQLERLRGILEQEFPETLATAAC